MKYPTVEYERELETSEIHGLEEEKKLIYVLE
jgi:hypothetical protein